AATTQVAAFCAAVETVAARFPAAASYMPAPIR
ncbi:MAG: hypothetical protein QOC73_1854, partial [Actinomycetota bacterium]|nr:hypothetical protein [Actinomycetota bacterium]